MLYNIIGYTAHFTIKLYFFLLKTYILMEGDFGDNYTRYGFILTIN